MVNEERKTRYLVILNKEIVLGDFANYDDAIFFAYVSALHGEKGELYEVYASTEGFEIG